MTERYARIKELRSPFNWLFLVLILLSLWIKNFLLLLMFFLILYFIHINLINLYKNTIQSINIRFYPCPKKYLLRLYKFHRNILLIITFLFFFCLFINNLTYLIFPSIFLSIMMIITAKIKLVNF
jgi:hypothetical protein